MSEIIKDRKLDKIDITIYSLFKKERFLDILEYFIIFDGMVKKIARYNQYFAIKKTIKRINNIKDENIIESGKKIVIPYIISKDDLKYYVSSTEYDSNIPLETYAALYETDVETLLQLNKEAIDKVILSTGEIAYMPISNTLQVPSFISKNVLDAQKEVSTGAYTKTNGEYHG